MVESLNRQRVLALLEAFYAGNIEGALARCDDEIEHVASAPIDILPHMGHHRGKSDVRQFWRTVHSRYCEMRHDVREIVAEGDKVAVAVRAFFRKRANQRVVQFDVAAFFTLREARVSRIREIIDTFDLVQQVLERDIAAVLTGRTPD